MFASPGNTFITGVAEIIKRLSPMTQHKSMFVNLDRIQCSIKDFSQYTPSNEVIWKSIRSVTLHCLTREFFWKSLFRVGDFWLHINTLEIRGQCHVCNVPESLEHITLECDAPGQRLIWNLMRQLWSKKYSQWPTLNWGLILGCNLARFKSDQGAILPEKVRLFAILVSLAWHLIWNLRRGRVIETPDRIQTNLVIHNQWLNTINAACQQSDTLGGRRKSGTFYQDEEVK
ncbi:hypothetical protein B0H10DRAFT_1835959 [Mycena sp. CBHHK59/15]|nr:hypothetical protein B0H10DRAFT_1835959 [Mycena sp. CBHHK59/15]